MVSPNLTPIVIAGPTASGKSALAMKLALELGGEIVCADSRQIYQRMSIGTACPSVQEYEQVCHHGFERLDPKENYSAGQFIEDTDAYILEIQARQKRPILVGGTGLYLRAWRFGLDDVLPADLQIRANLDQQDLPSLYERLKLVDPESAVLIKPSDSVRIKRALEIYEISGAKPSALRQTDWAREPRVQATWFLLRPAMSELDTHLRTRVSQMFDQGLVQEAVLLRDYLGEQDLCERLKTPGYLEALELSEQKIGLEQAKERVFRRHRQYAKRQNTWFKKETWWLASPTKFH